MGKKYFTEKEIEDILVRSRFTDPVFKEKLRRELFEGSFGTGIEEMNADGELSEEFLEMTAGGEPERDKHLQDIMQSELKKI